jgi:uncharacterized protein
LKSYAAAQARAAAAALLALWLCAACGAALAQAGVFEPLTIVSGGKRLDFQVEVMRTQEEHARGMMFRRSLAPDRGMLFELETERVASFWMENTYVPLDMIFIKADGTIHRIEHRAEPLSTRTVSSGAPVRAVLEVVAGTARRLGIKAGDRVEHAFFAGQ